MKVPKCSNCKKYPDVLIQTMELKMQVQVLAGGFIERHPEDSYEADHVKVEANCLCGHNWTLRGIRSASDFDIKKAGDETV